MKGSRDPQEPIYTPFCPSCESVLIELPRGDAPRTSRIYLGDAASRSFCWGAPGRTTISGLWHPTDYFVREGDVTGQLEIYQKE